MKKSLLLLLFLSQIFLVNAQDFEYHPTLVSVSFSGTPNTNYIQIRYDNNLGEFSAPHFIKSSFTRSPVGYVSGTKPTVSAKFLFQCSSPHPVSKIWLRGTHEKLHAGDVQYSFEAKQVPFVIGTEIEYPATASDNEFVANRVKLYDYNFFIKWEYSLSSDGPWKPAGESINPVYVTLGVPKPKNPSEGYDYFQTLIHIGCKYGVGVSTYSTLFSKMKAYFDQKNVVRADQLPMTYYGAWVCTNTTTRTLITSTDGQCGAWARLFLDIFKMQGYQSSNNYVTMYSKMDEGFYVKNWQFSNLPGSSGDPVYPFLNLSFISTSSPSNYEPYNYSGGFNWQKIVPPATPESPQVTDSAPLAGQNNGHPQSRFGNHQFVKMFGKYYDPSYGVSYLNLTSIDAAISAFYLPDNSGNYWRDVVRENPIGSDVELLISTY